MLNHVESCWIMFESCWIYRVSKISKRYGLGPVPAPHLLDDVDIAVVPETTLCYAMPEKHQKATKKRDKRGKALLWKWCGSCTYTCACICAPEIWLFLASSGSLSSRPCLTLDSDKYNFYTASSYQNYIITTKSLSVYIQAREHAFATATKPGENRNIRSHQNCYDLGCMKGIPCSKGNP